MYKEIEGKFEVVFIGEKNAGGVILGVEQPNTKAAKQVRYSLKEYNLPILMVSVKEAKVIRDFYKEFLFAMSFNERELYYRCQKDNVDYITVRRALGLEPAIGQQKQKVKDDEVREWVRHAIFSMRRLRSANLPILNQAATIAVWTSANSKLTSNVIEEARIYYPHIRFFALYLDKSYIAADFITLYKDKWQAIEEASGLLILEQEPAFSQISIQEWVIKKVKMKEPILIDPYSLYEPEEMNAIGFNYVSYGRPC